MDYRQYLTPEQLNAMYAQDEKANTDVLGALEALAAISSGAVAEPVAGLFGLLGAAATQDSGAAARGVEKAREALTYQPRRQEGQVALQNVAEGLAPIGEMIQGAQVGAGDYVFDKTESPLLAALTQAAVGGAPDIAGLKLGARALPDGPSFELGDIGSQMGGERGSIAGLERGQHGANHFIVGEQSNIAMPKKAQKRLADLDYKATYEPHIIKPKSLMDMIGEKGVLTMVDRTPTGGVIHEVRGKRLHTPQYLDGGDDFGTDLINDEAWANSGEYLNILQNRMGDDKSLNYLTMLMAPTSVDFPTMAPATHMRFAYPYTSKKDLKYVEDLIKKGAPDMGIKQGGDPLTPVPSFDWSIMDKEPTAVDQYLKTLSGPQRKSINAIFEALADPSPNQKKAGLRAMPDNFLTTQERQMLITKPEYRNLPSTMQITRGHVGGRNVGPADHFTYRSAVDKVDESFIPAEQLTAYDLMPELFPKSTRDYIHPNDAWTARMGARTFDINQALIDRLGEQGRFD